MDLGLGDWLCKTNLQIPTPKGDLTIVVDEAIEAIVRVVLHQEVFRLPSLQFRFDTTVVASALGPYDLGE